LNGGGVNETFVPLGRSAANRVAATQLVGAGKGAQVSIVFEGAVAAGKGNEEIW
jgi:hypothetical protein